MSDIALDYPCPTTSHYPCPLPSLGTSPMLFRANDSLKTRSYLASNDKT